MKHFLVIWRTLSDCPQSAAIQARLRADVPEHRRAGRPATLRQAHSAASIHNDDRLIAEIRRRDEFPSVLVRGPQAARGHLDEVRANPKSDLHSRHDSLTVGLHAGA